ncbi:MAG: lipoprotein N-acyltransferase Lnb domain-containing protein [Gemmatimonadota bacterium]
MKHLASAILFGTLTLQPVSLRGQAPAPQEPGSELEVYVMTMGRGDPVWAKFGHNALGIRDRSRGTDVVYNWGTFSFSESDFLPRFLRGHMRYWVERDDAAQTVGAYQQLNRSVWIQELNLTAGQRLEIRNAVDLNVLPENRYYRYDYFGDNCSTRVRDVLDRLLRGQLGRQFGEPGSGRSFRDEARRLTSDAPLLYTGIDIGLGSPADREMTRWEHMFLPAVLQEGLREVTIESGDGTSMPLVTAERELFRAQRPPDPGPGSTFTLRYLLAGGVLALLVTLGAARRWARWTAVAWCLVVGVVGLLLMALWTATSHVWAYRNVNLLFFNPLWLMLVPSIVRAAVPSMFVRRLATALKALSIVGLSFAVVGWLSGSMPQDVAQTAALAVLPNMAVLSLLLLRRAEPALPRNVGGA